MDNTTFNCASQTLYPVRFCNVQSQSACAQMNLAVVVTPKVSAFVSFISVSVIIFRFFTMKPRLRKTYDRIILMMSLMSLLGIIGMFVGNWTFSSIPANSVSSPLCNFQAWLIQINTAVFWYYTALATTFVVRIRYNWSDAKVLQYEPLLHAVGLTYPILTSILALSLRLFGKAGFWCFYPYSNDWARWAFYYGWLWPCMAYTAICMCIIVGTVKKTEDATAQHRRETLALSKKKFGKSGRLNQMTRDVAFQGVLHVSVFFLTYTFPTINRIQVATMASKQTGQCYVFALSFLHTLTIPLQGFFIFIAYSYPRIRAYQRKKAALLRQQMIALANQGPGSLLGPFRSMGHKRGVKVDDDHAPPKKDVVDINYEDENEDINEQDLVGATSSPANPSAHLDGTIRKVHHDGSSRAIDQQRAESQTKRLSGLSTQQEHDKKDTKMKLEGDSATARNDSLSKHDQDSANSNAANPSSGTTETKPSESETGTLVLT